MYDRMERYELENVHVMSVLGLKFRINLGQILVSL